MASAQVPKYEFLQTELSKSRSNNDDNLGKLISHNSMIFHMNSTSKDKKTKYYLCSKRRFTGCMASAIVDNISATEDTVEGIKQERWIVRKS